MEFNTRLSADILTLNADSSGSTEFTEESYTWTLVDNKTLRLVGQTHTLEISPFIETPDGYSALFVETANEEVVRKYVRELVKFDEPVDASLLSTSGSEAYITLIQATEPRAWESGKLALDFVFAYQFDQDNFVSRLVTNYENEDRKTDPYFDFSSTWKDRNVVQEETSQRFTFDSTISIRQRTWQFVKQDTSGRIWVLESFFFTRDSDQNGIFDRYTLVRPPGLTSFIKIDLSEYEEAWANTQERGIVD